MHPRPRGIRSAGAVLLALSCSVLSCEQDVEKPFVDTAYEPNDSRSTAASLGSGGGGTYSVAAYITDGDVDWFSIQIDAGSTLDIDSADGFTVRVYDSAGQELAYDREWRFNIVTTGTYYLKVYAGGGGSVQTIYGFTLHGGKGPGPYTLDFSITVPPPIIEDDMGTLADAGNDKASATAPPLLVGSGRLTAVTDPEDWYVVPIIAGKRVTVLLTSPAETDFDLEFISPGGTVIKPPEAGLGGAERVPYRALVDGYFWVRAILRSGEGVYQLSITFH